MLRTIERQEVDEDFVQELHDFGLRTLEDLDKLFTEEFLDELVGSISESTTMGVTRDAMIFSDIEKYLSQAWGEKWKGWSFESVEMLKKRYGKDMIGHILRDYDSQIIDWDDGEYEDIDPGF